MSAHKFDSKKLQKLNNPQRLHDIPPEFIWSKLSNQAPKTLVEIGAGTAFFCIAFLQRFKPERIYAGDLSAAMIGWMEENVKPTYPEILPVKTAEDRVPLADNCSDLVFMINLHHELEHPERSLKEAYRLLKPDGEIFIVDWKKKEMPEGPPAEIRCTPAAVEKQLLAAGFDQPAIYNDLEKHFCLVGKRGFV